MVCCTCVFLSTIFFALKEVNGMRSQNTAVTVAWRGEMPSFPNCGAPLSPSGAEVLTALIYLCSANQHVQKINWDIMVASPPHKTGHHFSLVIALPFCFRRKRKAGGSNNNRLHSSLKGLVSTDVLFSHICPLSPVFIMCCNVVGSSDPGAAVISTGQSWRWTERPAVHCAMFLHQKGMCYLIHILTLWTNYKQHPITFTRANSYLLWFLHLAVCSALPLLEPQPMQRNKDA